MNDNYQSDLRCSLASIPLSDPPPPWQLVATHSIGGLTEVGYAANCDDLLVVSHQGRGVYDCLSGERTARDDDESWDGLDQKKLISPGIGPLASQTIRLAGFHGGGLPRFTSDGWGLDVVALEWPKHDLFLSHTAITDTGLKSHKYKINDDGSCEFRACGFSDTERSFIFATSCELAIYRRIAG